ncbi:GPW/gp25 family protein [Castellaniella sp.]|uniref:GPW/gp25 family protein n=1 Tax=Castellaniella sp. TaxID=1955812 RepID=UPI002AFFE130|nr:GPW/gp25 family protein [Castellaniella sp.]
MAASVGVNRRTGQLLTDWEHVEQSIAVILTTRIGQRVMRREFGSEVPALIDRPMTTRVILAVYAATANALCRWEPRFRLTKCELAQASVDGTLHLLIGGDYMPRGHLGDYTVATRREFTVALAA